MTKSRGLRTRHGKGKTSIYGVWSAMVSRCHNENNPAFKNYGGRGIFVCDEWRKFTGFFNDMGEPETGKSLDRIDNDKGYYPENCRWVSRTIQARNNRKNRFIAVNGEKKLLCEWSELTGLSSGTIWNRIKLGWSESDAVTTPLVTFRKGIKLSPGTRLKDYQPIDGAEHGVTFNDQRSAA